MTSVRTYQYFILARSVVKSENDVTCPGRTVVRVEIAYLAPLPITILCYVEVGAFRSETLLRNEASPTYDD